MEKVIAFDLGKVIFDFDYNLALQRMEGKIKASREEIINALFYQDFATDFEKGVESEFDFYCKFKDTFKANISYQDFIDIWCDIFSPRYDVIEIVERLRLMHPVYLISNINKPHYEHLCRRWGKIFSLFDKLILSFQIKSIKPEKTIYEQLINKNYTFSDVIYIDDREDLIREAEKLGLDCIRFVDTKSLIDELEKRNVHLIEEQEKQTLLEVKKKLKSANNPVIVGIGSVIRGDDGVGALIAKDLKGKLNLEVLDVEIGLENYLGKIERHDFVLMIDGSVFNEDVRFRCFLPQEANVGLNFTHNPSFSYLSDYLKDRKKVDILILAIKIYNLGVKTSLSLEVEKSKTILERFFLKNFS